MKRLIAAIVLAFASIAQAEDTREYLEMKEGFLEGMVKQGKDISKCRVDQVEADDKHVVVSFMCEFAPFVCVAVAERNAGPEVPVVIECDINPGYVPEQGV